MWFFVVIVALIRIVAGIAARKNAGTAEQNPWPLAPKPILSEREQLLFRRLEAIFPNHRIFVQVALSQLIEVKSGTSDFRSIRNRYSQLVAVSPLSERRPRRLKAEINEGAWPTLQRDTWRPLKNESRDELR